MKYLLDTNVISELAKPRPSPSVVAWTKGIPSTYLFTSALTLGEFRYGIEKLPDNAQRRKLLHWLEIEVPDWFSDDHIVPIDAEIADRWGRLRAEIRRSLPITDSLIAASALVHNFTLVTRNTRDFKDMPLELLNPWES